MPTWDSRRRWARRRILKGQLSVIRGLDEKRELGSSPGDSLRGSRARFEEGEGKPDDCSLALSYCFDVIEREGGGSGDEDGYVYVPCGGSPG